MFDERRDFVDALEAFVSAALRNGTEPADYNPDAVQIMDARNHLFRLLERQGTDEEQRIYALRELCRIDEETLTTVPDRWRMATLAKDLIT